MPVVVLKNTITKTEYLKWLSYHKYKAPDPTEIQLAVISAMIAQGLGSKDSTAEDFLLHKRKVQEAREAEANDTPEMNPNEVESFFGMLSTPME